MTAQRIGLAVGIDVGGTFTDVVVADGGIGFGKVSTTPEAPEQGVLAGLARIGVRPNELETFVHGSTIVLNAILERRGAPTALVTTHGFRDVLEIMRTNRPDMYNLQQEKPEPLVPRRLRLEVRERVAVDGSVLEELVEDDVRAAAAAALECGVETFAVCLLNAYANDTHERRVRELLAEAAPELPVTISSDLSREWREFERTSTTVVNAYVRPLVDDYARGIEAHFDLAATQVFVMKSSGGVGTLAEIRAEPVSTIMSGPVGGVIAAEHVARQTGVTELLTLDIGGTSADMCLVSDGRGGIVPQREVDRFPVMAATVDVHSIGAGGGSIAWIDRGGALRCGPRSAGARPGPACYGRGGTEPTATDAHVVLGHIDPSSFLGGEMPLDAAAARAAIEPLAARLDMSVEEAAVGIVRILDLRTVEAIRRLAMRAGCDLRDYALLAFGGAGPMHGAELCRELDVARMIVPVAPGTFSALGLLLADLRRDHAETRVLEVEESTEAEVEALFRSLESRAGGGGELVLSRTADMRYDGQEFVVNAAAPAGATALRASFEEAHERLYGYRLPGQPVLLVTARVSAVASRERPELAPPHTGDGAALKGTRRMFELHGDEWRDWPIYERTLLAPGDRVHGPAIVEEQQSTTVVGPGDELEVDAHGNLHVTIGAAR